MVHESLKVAQTRQKSYADKRRRDLSFEVLGTSQVEGLDFAETFAPVVRLEAIRYFLPTLHLMTLNYIKWM
jgi:hypothetical protein